MKYPLREKSLEEITGGHWFVFGEHPDGTVDVSEANRDVFTNLKPGVAQRVIAARSLFLRQLYWLLCEAEPTTPPDQTLPERMMAQ